MWTICPHWFLLPQRVDKRPFRLMCSFWTHEASGCQLPFSLHGFPAPFRRRFPALPYGVMAVYLMQTVFRFSRFIAGFAIKKSPHNNLNLTILSGMALVRVRYVAIRKLKTCFDSFGSRAGTLSKYVILNCWDRLPQKSSHVNKKVLRTRWFRQLARKHKETLVKRERAGRCQPSWQNYEMLKNFCCFYCVFQK